MIRHALKLILRSWIKTYFYTITILVVLSTSLAIACLTVAFGIHELGQDTWLGPNVYRVDMVDPINFTPDIITYHELPKGLISDFPSVRDVCHIYYPGKIRVSLPLDKGNPIFDDKAIYIDSSFFNLFRLQIISESNMRWTDGRSVLLSEKTARTYFGSVQGVGKSLLIEGKDFEVSGIFKEIPSNSNLQFNLLIPSASLGEPSEPLDFGGLTYIRLWKNNSVSQLENLLNTNLKTLFTFKSTKPIERPFSLESTADSYSNTTYSDFLRPIVHSRDKVIVFTYFIIAFAIVIISCLNFIVYYYSKILFQTKGIRINRIFGAPKTWLLSYFTLDSTCVVFAALLLSWPLSYIVLPYFNRWSNSEIPYSFFLNSNVLGLIITVTVTISLCLGATTLILFSNRRNSNSLRDGIVLVSGKNRALNFLITVQLVASTTAILYLALISSQINFFDEHPIGFDRTNLIEMDIGSMPDNSNPQTLKTEILKLNGVQSASVCFGGPLSGRWTRSWRVDDVDYQVGLYQADNDFAKTLRLRFVQGSDFPNLVNGDTSYLLINNTAKAVFHLGEDLEDTRHLLPFKGKIVGIVSDFNYSSFKDRIGPVFIQYAPYTSKGIFGGRMLIRVTAIDQNVISSLKRVWSHYGEDAEFKYTIVSEDFDLLNAPYFKTYNLLRTLSLAFIAISCLGVAGFAYFTGNKRLKEFAIRKTLGASNLRIVSIWLRIFLSWIIISVLIALPLSFYLFYKWLSYFAYQARPSLQRLILSILAIVIMILISSTVNIVKTIRVNPTKLLNSE